MCRKSGGRRENPATSDPDEKIHQCGGRNGHCRRHPVPVAYVLENERGINAFAAGYTPDDAVVAVTDGCLRRPPGMNSGVVAHEFSHILNGDMRLNIRLIAMISGILVIASIGRLALRPGIRTRKNDLPFMLAGLALVIIGYAGVVVSRMIQSAVSRQREYLADASAVQFTRNPPGIAGALKSAGLPAAPESKRPGRGSQPHVFFHGYPFGFSPPIRPLNSVSEDRPVI
ncbi:MAG: M48 family metalloprotease [Desulfobacterales bacterium]